MNIMFSFKRGSPQFSLGPIYVIPGLIFMSLAFLGLKFYPLREHFMSQITFSPPILKAASPQQGLEYEGSTPKEKRLTSPSSQKELPNLSKQESHPQQQPAETIKDASSASSLEPIDLFNLTTQDLQILQSLDKKRSHIKKWEIELSKREEYLSQIEERVNQKIDELQNIRSILKENVIEHEKLEDQQLKSLIKIYEIMKPQEAAVILSGVELEILLSVMERMKEQKASAILAAMEPFVSQRITVELAERLKVNKTLQEIQ